MAPAISRIPEWFYAAAVSRDAACRGCSAWTMRTGDRAVVEDVVADAAEQRGADGPAAA
jgi:hypothetical protein